MQFEHEFSAGGFLNTKERMNSEMAFAELLPSAVAEWSL